MINKDKKLMTCRKEKLLNKVDNLTNLDLTFVFNHIYDIII